MLSLSRWHPGFDLSSSGPLIPQGGRRAKVAGERRDMRKGDG